MSPVETLLARLDGVRKHGRHWIAVCPAHADTSPSLSIAECDDGKVLVHCFAGCSALSVVQAVGLTLANLFPERHRDNSPTRRASAFRARQHSDWVAALAVLSHESTLVLVAAKAVASGICLEPDAMRRVERAATLIEQAQEVLRAR